MVQAVDAQGPAWLELCVRIPSRLHLVLKVMVSVELLYGALCVAAPARGKIQTLNTLLNPLYVYTYI